MSRPRCWVIENYEYRSCPQPSREFCSLVSLHNHSSYSIENLATLNEVVARRFMRPLKGTLQRAFGLEWVQDMDYTELCYNPPSSPEDVFRAELEDVRDLGFDHINFVITDHDEIAGSVALWNTPLGHNGSIAIGEELSVRYRGHVFHLGISGLPGNDILNTHSQIRTAAREGRLDELFELLLAIGCLVVLNHPLLPWPGSHEREIPVEDFLRRYGWAIDALEYNGVRCRDENDRVLDLAKHVGKPVVGGGDSHLLVPSSAICGSPDAKSFTEFVEEVKSGRGVPLIKNEYFAPLKWKLFLRVLCFIAHYRQIAHFRGESAQDIVGDRMILLDPAGWVARAFLDVVGLLGMVR